MGKAYGLGSVDFTTREQLDVIKKDGNLLREAFLGSDVPGGQIENGPPVSQESQNPQKNPQKSKEIILVRADDVEWLNCRFPTASLTEGESLLRLFLLTCQGPECEDLVCNHGRYKEVGKDCHKVLGETEMFTLRIEFPTPLNFLREKCFEKKK